MNWLAIVVLALIIWSGFNGYKKGFIITAFSMVALILTVVITMKVYPQGSKLLIAYTKIDQKIGHQVTKMLETGANSNGGESLQLEAQKMMIQTLPVPNMVKEALINNNNPEAYNVLKATGFTDYVTAYITRLIVNAISFVIIFIIISIALWLCVRALNIISKLPVLNSMNKLAGLITGAGMGLIKVWFLFVIITMISGTALGKYLFTLINGSEALSFLYNYNYLIKILLNLSKMIA